jgi:hypothetical protein
MLDEASRVAALEILARLIARMLSARSKREGSDCKGEYQIFHKDKAGPYFPIFEARFPLKELKALARELSDYIAQPARANWDGESIERIVIG